MQVKKQTIAKKVLLDLAKHLNVKGIQGVADFIGEDKNKLYAWSKRGKIVDTGSILDKCPEIRKEWLESGEGEMIRKNYLTTGKDIDHDMTVRERTGNLKAEGKPWRADSPPRVVRETTVDMLDWLADNQPSEYYELLDLIRAAHNRCRDNKN